MNVLFSSQVINMDALDFGDAFKYPFNRPKGLLNILWILLPIFGWFALGGYGIRIMNEWVEGKVNQLPQMSFVDDMKLGFMIFIKSIPLVLAIMVLSWVLSLGKGLGMIIFYIVVLLVVPMLGINLVVKKTVASSFEFEKVKPVFSNFGDYIVALIKELVLGIIFLVLYVVLVGIPAGAFTKNIFFADFYKRHAK
ncbi:DUF4013 domain-containing protein [Nanoarchaeota archaeon]